MITSLENGDVDAAFVLTDCAVAAISRGVSIRLVSQIVASPLVWGVISKTTANDTALRNVENLPWAVSRHGSGSDVMLKVYAGDEDEKKVATKVCGNFDGMVKSVLCDETRGFLWERSTTRGLLRKMDYVDEKLGIVDTVTTPWSAFVCVVGADSPKIQAVKDAVSTFLSEAHKWKIDVNSPSDISRKYGMTAQEATEWVDAVKFADIKGEFDMNMLENTRKVLVDAKVIAQENAGPNLRDFIL